MTGKDADLYFINFSALLEGDKPTPNERDVCTVVISSNYSDILGFLFTPTRSTDNHYFTCTLL